MPELPEVETTARGIQKRLKGLTITDIWTDYGGAFHVGKKTIKDATYFKRFKKAIVGKKIEGGARRAKNVLIHLSGNTTIIVHMKMTGHLLYGTFKKVGETWVAIEPESLKDPYNRFIHLVLSLSNGKHLALSDARKFAKVIFSETGTLEEHVDLKGLGPEPLLKSFTYQRFVERLLMRPKGRIKSVLMDQSVIAGIGNIYSDEILWLGDVHPESHPVNVPEKNLKAMFNAMKKILNKGIDFGGDSTSDYRNIDGVPGSFHYHHQAYQNKGKPCGKRGCGGTILRKIIGGRSAHFCDTHQQRF